MPTAQTEEGGRNTMVSASPLDTVVTTQTDVFIFSIAAFIHNGYQADNCYHEEEYQHPDHRDAEIIDESQCQNRHESCQTNEQ